MEYRLCRFFSVRQECNEAGENTKFRVLFLKFILYSRSDCPLCETMEQELRPFIQKYNISVRRQLIDNEVTLQALYGDKVPVLTLDEKIICHYFLDTDVLQDAIEKNT